ncbi:MAG: cytochrome c biogenesis protein CcsA [Bacteroidota bacterium]|nr:cytochrome c biogenesis protein CcsA [Candidatus Kapabacteria bacterium]MDW8220661.1 cytochrome c biogenesis protein CcsA [Bacteroidota bacterium]
MKFLIQFSGVALGLAISLYIPLEKPRPLWWRWIAITLLTLMTVLALGLPIAGTFSDAVLLKRIGAAHPQVPVKVRVHAVLPNNQHPMDGFVFYVMTDARDEDPVQAIVRVPVHIASQLTIGQTAILQVERDSLGIDNMFFVHRLVTNTPFLTLPYIPQLEERARNLYFHVPMSWVGMLAYIVAMVFGIRYLITRTMLDDIISSSAAALGTLYTILATLTGAIWAKFNWGTFWNWDPRQTSIFILLMIYSAYFALRQAIDTTERRARISAAYVVFAIVPAIFLMFIMPRMMEGLHPGSANDANVGPILSTSSDDLNLIKQAIFSLAFGGFTMLFFWMLSLHIRIHRTRLAQEQE